MHSGFVIGDRGLGAAGDTHPDWMMAHAEAGSYLVAGASSIGQIHLSRGRSRDDAFVIRFVDPWLAVGVADGVGSRPLSRYGATYAVESLTSMLIQALRPAPKALQSEPNNEPLNPDRARLAPPSKVEDVNLDRGVLQRSPRASEVARSIWPWIHETILRRDQATAEPVPPSLRQASSIGWQAISSSDTARPTGSKSTANSAHSQVVSSSQFPAKVTPDPTHSEPNLVAIIQQAFEKTHLGLRDHANRLKLELADLSCTALALLFNVKTQAGAVGQVGDGALLGLTAQNKIKELVSAPETGDPQSVYTLNRPNFQDYLAVQVIQPMAVEPLVALYVMTDGLSGDLLYTSQTKALELWALGVDRNLRLSPTTAQAGAGMLNWLATYEVKGSWDDRTLVVITQREREDEHHQSIAGQSEPAQPTHDS